MNTSKATRKVIVAPDKFRGSLSAAQAAQHIAVGLRRADPQMSIVCVPIADGGEGTLDAALAAGYDRVPVEVDGPIGNRVLSAFARRGGTAVIELADASGLRRLPGGRAAPLTASSFGVGQLVAACLGNGVDTIVLGLGGSACTDGGAGMMAALGARLVDSKGQPVPRGGGALASIEDVDLSGVDPRLAEMNVVVATDVDNPLLGSDGAAATFGPQKGAGTAEVEVLEAGLHQWADVLARVTGTDARDRPGAGAAGGVGFAAMSVFGARPERGIDVVMRLTGLRGCLVDADLVVTGEGSLDSQSLRGKAPVGVARAARSMNVPVVAVAGRATLDRADLHLAGIDAVYALSDVESDAERSMRNAGPLLERIAGGIFDTWLRNRARP